MQSIRRKETTLESYTEFTLSNRASGSYWHCRDIAEFALARSMGPEVERANQRLDMLEHWHDMK